jgi:peptidoglycan hydrolase-like protein with peptidoglycan-binding domain
MGKSTQMALRSEPIRRPGLPAAGPACAAIATALLLGGMCAFPAPVSAQDVEPVMAESDDADAAANDLPLMGSEVRQVQQALRERGFFVGPADGRREPKLRAALRDFQRTEGLPVTGSLDKGTLVRLDLAFSDVAEARDLPEAPEARSEPRTVHAPPARKKDGATRDVVSLGKAGLGGVGHAVAVSGTSVGKAGQATGEAAATGGKAVAKAGAEIGDATATAAVVSAEAVAVGAVTVAKAPVALYSTGKRAIFGGEKETSDEKIRRSLESRYSEDNRIVPEEVEVRVAGGNVTLVVPQNPRTDVAYAARLAKLTPGVLSVNAIYRAAEAFSPAEPTGSDATEEQTPPPSSEQDGQPPQ